MSDDAPRADGQLSALPLTVDDLRRLNDHSLMDATRQALLEHLERLPLDRRDSVMALLDMLLALRAIPEEHRDVVHVVLTFFSRLSDEQRSAYLKLRPRSEHKKDDG